MNSWLAHLGQQRRWLQFAVLLLMIGWLLPDVRPPYVVAVGREMPSYSGFYEGYTYCVENGFCSKGLIIHEKFVANEVGHSLPKGHWIPGSLLSAWIPISGMLIVWCRKFTRGTAGIWMVLRALLVGFGVVTSIVVGEFPTAAVSLLSSYFLYLAITWACYRWSRKRGSCCDRGMYGAVAGILFYPWWILSQGVIQGAPLSFGLGFTATGAVIMFVAALAQEQNY